MLPKPFCPTESSRKVLEIPTKDFHGHEGGVCSDTPAAADNQYSGDRATFQSLLLQTAYPEALESGPQALLNCKSLAAVACKP